MNRPFRLGHGPKCECLPWVIPRRTASTDTYTRERGVEARGCQRIRLPTLLEGCRLDWCLPWVSCPSSSARRCCFPCQREILYEASQRVTVSAPTPVQALASRPRARHLAACPRLWRTPSRPLHQARLTLVATSESHRSRGGSSTACHWGTSLPATLVVDLQLKKRRAQSAASLLLLTILQPQLLALLLLLLLAFLLLLLSFLLLLLALLLLGLPTTAGAE